MSIHQRYKDKPVYKLSELAVQAQASVQQQCRDLDPLIGVNHGMRAIGFAADILTIDNVPGRKRLTFILKDELPTVVEYQFGFTDRDPLDEFQRIEITELTTDKLIAWMKLHLSSDD